MVGSPRFPPLPSVRDVLKMYQITAKKNLSQNFILDPSVLRKFAKSLGNTTNKYVIEVGPGPGGITRALLEQNPKKVFVIEKDPRFIPSLKLLQDTVGGEKKLQIHIGDCLYYNVEKLIPSDICLPWTAQNSPDVFLCGNLPFNVATPFLIRLIKSMAEKSNIFTFGRVSSVLTFQHEVAHRMSAEPNDPERSRLSVMCQNYADVKYLYTLDGGSFVPPPEVQVGVVKLTPLRKPYICRAKDEPFPFPFVNKVTSVLFHNKKKILRTNIANLFPKNSEIDPYKMAKIILDITSLQFDRQVTSLTLDEIEKICLALEQVCNDKNIHLDFIHPYLHEDFLKDEKLLNQESPPPEETEKRPKFEINFS